MRNAPPQLAGHFRWLQGEIKKNIEPTAGAGSRRRLEAEVGHDQVDAEEQSKGAHCKECVCSKAIQHLTPDRARLALSSSGEGVLGISEQTHAQRKE